MEPKVIVTRPPLISLVAYLDERASLLTQPGGEQPDLDRLLRDCVQMICLVMGVYYDIPLSFTTLSNSATRLVRAEHDPVTALRALVSAIRLLRDAAAHRGEQIDKAVPPISYSAIRSYFDVRDTVAPLPRRIKGQVVHIERRGVPVPDGLPEVLKQTFGLPEPAVLERVLEALRDPAHERRPT